MAGLPQFALFNGVTRRAWLVCGGLFVSFVYAASSASAQSFGEGGINDQLRFTPKFIPRTAPAAPSNAPAGASVAELLGPTPPKHLENYINADYLGRAGLLGDNTRMASFAGGNFLPSAIPVAGQPFFGSGPRANLQGDGNAVRVNAYAVTPSGGMISGSAQLLVQSASLSTGAADNANVTFREAFARLNRLSIGLMETAFADPASVPETLDLAGPNARVTVNPAGLGSGQGRLGYSLFSDGFEGGWLGNLSLEQPQPQLETGPTTATFSRTPDGVASIQYSDGEVDGEGYHEAWHLKFASVFRDIGLENDTNTFEQHVFGWGTSLSGACRFHVNPDLQTRDRIMFSITYGEGISHYITDLNAATDTNDAVVNGAGSLQTLPVLAWYTGYLHNWTDTLRSTLTYSQVNLDSIAPAVPGPSPYQRGQYAALNLVYHRTIWSQFPTDDALKRHNFFTGIEYLFGEKETLDGADGRCQRVMWVTSFNN